MFKFIKKLYRKIFSIKRINMLPQNKLKKLKELAIELKEEIRIHHENDPGNIDDFSNGELFGALDSAERSIEKIEKNNNIIL